MRSPRGEEESLSKPYTVAEIHIQNLFYIEVDKCSVARQRPVKQTKEYFILIFPCYTRDITLKSIGRSGLDLLFNKNSERTVSHHI
jgi:hypothetical protein